jgi:mevalonate pyrophosphate decarboxylase
LRTGSRNSATGSSQQTDHQDTFGDAMTDLRKTRSTSAVRAMVTVVSRVTATGMGTSASGASSTAAIGG